MYLDVPILAPINVVDRNRVLPENYNWKHLDGWLAPEQITAFEQHKCDAQKWQFTDICFLQVRADFTPVRLQVRNSRGLVILQEVFSIAHTIGDRIYLQAQVAFDDPVFAEGGYFLCEILAGDPVLITLEATIWHIAENHPGTILLTYQNDFNNEVLWQTGIYMNLRVDGAIPFDKPGSVRTVYVDQQQSQVTVKGDAYRVFKFYVGTEGGIPPWVIDKLEDIINQTNVLYDGKAFAPVSGATWSPKKIERYPWVQWNIEMREVINRRFKRFESDGIQEQKVVIDYNVTLKLFGPIAGSANDNTVTINEIE